MYVENVSWTQPTIYFRFYWQNRSSNTFLLSETTRNLSVFTSQTQHFSNQQGKEASRLTLLEDVHLFSAGRTLCLVLKQDVSPPWIHFPAFFLLSPREWCTTRLYSFTRHTFSPTSDRRRNASFPLGWEKKEEETSKRQSVTGNEKKGGLIVFTMRHVHMWLAVFVHEASGGRSVRRKGAEEKGGWGVEGQTGVSAKLEKCVLFETKHFRGKVHGRQVNRAVIHLLCWQWDVVCQREIHFALKNISRLRAAADLGWRR